MSFISKLFGGGGAGVDKAQKEAAQLQAVSADRQMAEVNRQAALASTARKAPRGQRLFSDGPSGAPSKLGA
jgi:hypothetical protein